MKMSSCKLVNFRIGVTLGALLALNSASAVVVNPGSTELLTGTTSLANPDLTGTIIRDVLVPFQLTDTLGNVLLEGNVQDRVIRSDNTGQLIFAPRLRDLDAPAGDSWVVGFSMQDYGGFSTDIDYRTDGLGDVGAYSVSRSVDGEYLAFSYHAGQLLPPDASYFMSVATDATGYDLSGMFTLYAQNDFGTTGFSAQISGVSAPSAVPLPAAAWLFGSGLAGMIAVMRRREQDRH